MSELRQSDSAPKVITIGVKRRRCRFCGRFIPRNGGCRCGGVTLYYPGGGWLALKGHPCS